MLLISFISISLHSRVGFLLDLHIPHLSAYLLYHGTLEGMDGWVEHGFDMDTTHQHT